MLMLIFQNIHFANIMKILNLLLLLLLCSSAVVQCELLHISTIGLHVTIIFLPKK